jgi:hypothetical protein
VLIDPARVGKPRDKARVERPMPYIRDSFWRGWQFTSLPPDAHRRGALVSGGGRSRRHRWLDGAAPAAVFTAVEAGALRPLPAPAFELAAWSTGKVGPDIHVKVGAALYSAPWRLIGQRLDARQTWTTVQLFHNGVPAATHPRADRDVHAHPGQGHGLDEVRGQQRLGVGAQEVCPGRGGSLVRDPSRPRAGSPTPSTRQP